MSSLLPFILNIVYFGLIVLLISYYEMRKCFFTPLKKIVGNEGSNTFYFLKMKLINSTMKFSPLLLAIFLSMLYISPNCVINQTLTSAIYDETLLGIILLYLFVDITLLVVDVQKGGEQKVPELVTMLLLLFVFLISILNIHLLDVSLVKSRAYRWISYFFLWFSLMQKNSYASLFKHEGILLQSILVYFVFFQFFNSYLMGLFTIAIDIAVIARVIIFFVLPLVQVIISLTLQRLYNKLVINYSYKENYKVLLLFIFILILIEGRLLT